MLKRDPKYIASHLTLKGDAYYTDKQTVIEFPSWYEEKGLYSVTDKTFIYGLFAIIIDDKYSVSLIPTIMYTTPISTVQIDRDGEKYTQLIYGAGDCLIDTNKIIMQTYLIYNFFDSHFMQAKVPWFLGYEDLCRVMGNTKKYAGSDLGSSDIANEVITSFIARTKADKLTFYRQAPNKELTFVDLMDVRYSTLSTVNKLAGNYFEESLVSALVQKEKTPTTLENLVRK
jgi:TusA-related sulfurtransferase